MHYITHFQIFWHVQNRLRALEGQPEMLYGEARDLWLARRTVAAIHIFSLRMARAGGKKLEVVK